MTPEQATAVIALWKEYCDVLTLALMARDQTIAELKSKLNMQAGAPPMPYTVTPDTSLF